MIVGMEYIMNVLFVSIRFHRWKELRLIMIITFALTAEATMGVKRNDYQITERT